MLKDTHGLPVSTASGQAAEDFNRALLGYLKYRVDTPDHLARSIAADPAFGLAHCTRGYFLMLANRKDNVPVAAQAAATARSLTAGATRREQLHVSALEAWVAGELDTMLAIWESILKAHPTDVLAFRLPTEEAAAFRRLARSANLPVSTILRQIVRDAAATKAEE